MATILEDIHHDIIHTHILPRLDCQSLFTVATVSSPAISSDHHLWSQISKFTFPSVTHPHVDKLISTFEGGHKSFFRDSFPSLITDLNKNSDSDYYPDNHQPSKLISAVDMHYQNDVIYSTVQFTDTTKTFLSSELLVKLNEDAINNRLSESKPVLVEFKADELAGEDETILSDLKESLSLSWILIDPNLKRAGNLSSIKPISVKKGWMTNDILVQFATVLPGCDPNEMVECRIRVVMGVGNEGVGLHVKEVTMKLMDMDSCCLNGKDFLVISQRAILGENNVIRKVVGDEEILQSRCKFKEMKKQKRRWLKEEEHKRKYATIMNYFGLLVSFCFSVYFWSLKLR